MLYGYPPFYSEDPSVTYNKILNWEEYFEFPDDIIISNHAMDLISKLINNADERLGKNGVNEIKAHPFFCGIDWKKIRNKKAPFIPEIKNITDTKYFDKFDEEEPWIESESKNKNYKKKDVIENFHFCGFTLKKKLEKEKNKFYETYLASLE